MHNTLFTAEFEERIVNTHGEDGLTWLNDLQNIISKAKGRYNLSNIKVLPNLSFNYVTTDRQNNERDLIVKFCLPGNETE